MTLRLLPSFLAALFAVVPLARGAEDNQVFVGRMGDVTLTAAEARRITSLLGPDAKRQLAESDTDLEKVIRLELVRRTVLAEAREKGYDKKSDVQFLMERGREQALMTAYVQNLVRPSADYPSEDEVKAANEAVKGRLMVPVQYHVSNIQLGIPVNADKAKQDAVAKRATELAARLQGAPQEFAQTAREVSGNQFAAKGGDMGWWAESKLAPDARTEAEKLEKGAVSGAFRVRNAWHIIKVNDKKPSRQRSFEESRALLVATLRQRKLQENERAYLENVAQKANLQINQVELSRVQDGLRK